LGSGKVIPEKQEDLSDRKTLKIKHLFLIRASTV